MMKIRIITLLAGLFLMVPAAYSGEHGSMSDAQHRKSMSGMHHPEQTDDGTKKAPASMSDSQHRKMMGGSMQHPDQGSDTEASGKAEKKGSTMSDSQHRKSMGGMHHPAGE